MTHLLPTPARYVPYGEIRDQPNIIVDGKENSTTVLTLSHWPWTTTPEELRRDTSTEIAYAYLHRPDMHQVVPIVSNSHFDEDGLLSMFALVSPETALEHESLLIDTARAGDFGVCTSADAARLSFILAAFADPETSPFPADTFTAAKCDKIATLYRQMLVVLPRLLGNIDEYREYWRDEFQHLEQSRRYLEEGVVEIGELPDVDTALIRIPPGMPMQIVRRYLERWNRPVHPFAIHTQTPCNRLVWIQGQRIEFQYRYESWVQLATRRTSLRVDLSSLAEELNGLETSGGEWLFEGVNEVAPRLHLVGCEESSIGTDFFIATLVGYLKSQPAAWDPYRKPEDR